MAERSLREGLGDDGFTLIEVIVALGIFLLVMIATLPLLLIGIRAGDSSQQLTQAKNIAQSQLARMRNMPYHVQPLAGPYRDVLDYYFRNRTVPVTTSPCTSGSRFVVPQTSWTGYVDDGATARCSYEPPSGAFYRRVESASSPGYMVVVDTQFLGGTTPPTAVTPRTGYNTQTETKDTPATSQIGVTVTVFQRGQRTDDPVSTYTQISDQPQVPLRIKARVDASTIDLASETTTNGTVSLSAGLLHLSGFLTFGSNAAASLSATSAGLGTGEQRTGASTALSAPPGADTTPVTGLPGGLAAGCALACWGGTRLDEGVIVANDGLPNVGDETTPMQSLVTDLANSGFTFGNGASTAYRPELGFIGPLVRLDAASTASASGVTSTCQAGNGVSSYVAASGFVKTTAEGEPSQSVQACGLARAGTISLFPTDFAPHGVVKVDLQRASANCQVGGGAAPPTASADYQAVVRYHMPGELDSYSDPIVISPGTPDALATVDLSTPVGGNMTLGDYVASWSATTSDHVKSLTTDNSAEVRLPGVLSIVSKPTRALPSSSSASPSASTTPSASLSPSATAATDSASATPTDAVSASASTSTPTSPSSTETPVVVSEPDPTSALSMTVGSVSCIAQDKR